jgi:hypothetical protein
VVRFHSAVFLTVFSGEFTGGISNTVVYCGSPFSRNHQAEQRGRPLLQMASNWVASRTCHGSIHRNSTASDWATHFIASLKGLTDLAKSNAHFGRALSFTAVEELTHNKQTKTRRKKQSSFNKNETKKEIKS